MRSKWVLLLLLITSVVATGTATLNNQKQSSSSKAGEKKFDRAEFESQFPLVDYDKPETTDPGELKRRRAIGKKHDNAEIPVSDRSTEISSVTHWETGLPALPMTQSQVVVIGKVLDAQAYLSNDKTGVYSEFTIHLEEVLKNDSGEPLMPSGSLIAERSGGRVRFPSGRITLQQIIGQGMPRVGRSYVFFLTRPNPEQNYQILTGYELKTGYVDLLDNPGGGTHPIAKYKGAEVTSFLTNLRAALANPSQPTPTQLR